VKIPRRGFCSLLPLTLLAGRSFAEAEAISSFATRFEDLPVNKRTNAQFRAIAKGKTPTGERVELHQTVLEPGAAPHGAHSHAHSEFWLVREGTIEITIKGKKTQLGPGSVGFAAANEEHGVRNVGKIPASYFVIAIGPTA